MEIHLKQAIAQLQRIRNGVLAEIDCARYSRGLPPRDWTRRLDALIADIEQALKTGK